MGIGRAKFRPVAVVADAALSDEASPTASPAASPAAQKYAKEQAALTYARDHADAWLEWLRGEGLARDDSRPGDIRDLPQNHGAGTVEKFRQVHAGTLGKVQRILAAWYPFFL